MTVRVGFLGAGFIAGYHAGMLGGAIARGEAEIVAVFDPADDRAVQFAARHGAIVAGDPEELITGIDAVYVTTWTAEHRELVERAAKAGKAVFCEKPLAATVADAVAMVQAVEAAGVTHQVGLVLRDSPSFLLLRHLVRRPQSGRIMTIAFRDDQFIPTQGMYASTWRSDPAKAGAGTLLEHSIHDLDLLEWIGGPVAEVSARTRMFHAIAGIEDLAVATLSYDSGAIATLTSVWHDVLSRPSMRHVEVFCENAYYALEGDVLGPVRWTVDREGDRHVAGSEMFAVLTDLGIVARNADEAFVRSVAAGEPAYPSMAEALRAHVLAEACYRSAAAGSGGGQLVAVPSGLPGDVSPR